MGQKLADFEKRVAPGNSRREKVGRVVAELVINYGGYLYWNNKEWTREPGVTVIGELYEYHEKKVRALDRFSGSRFSIYSDSLAPERLGGDKMRLGD